MPMRDRKVIDGSAFYDSISFDELWAQVHAGRRVVVARRVSEASSVVRVDRFSGIG
jgi:hypothetical protein